MKDPNINDAAIADSIRTSLADEAKKAIAEGGNIRTVSAITKFNEARVEFFLSMVRADRDGIPHGVITAAAAATLGALYASVVSSCLSPAETEQVVRVMGETYGNAMTSAMILSQPLMGPKPGETVQ